MKRFTFRLQKLLEIRQKKEDQQKIILAKASGEYQKELRKQQAIQEHEHTLREKVKQDQGKSDLSRLKWLDYYGWHSKKIEGDLNRHIEEKKQTMEKELALYTKMRQEKRAVEILREKAWQAHQEAVLKEEQHILDELSQIITHKNPKYADTHREEKGGEKP